MEKIKLGEMVKEYHAEQKEKAKRRAVTLVEEKIIPELIKSAKIGKCSYTVDVLMENVYASDVHTELAKRVECIISGYGKKFTVHW